LSAPNKTITGEHDRHRAAQPDQAMNTCSRHSSPVYNPSTGKSTDRQSLSVLDLNGFKNINDEWSHDIGDWAQSYGFDRLADS
jgi:GGDEF domain-containing protein